MRDPDPRTSTGEPEPDDVGPAGHSRWHSPITRVEAFWPILGIVLAVAVAFVASVAHTSIDGVGVTTGAIRLPPRTSATPAPTLVIVQISSHQSDAGATTALEELAGRGIEARQLKSDNYSPLNPGFYVLYLGPYPDTTSGRDEAERVRSQIPGALIREIRSR